VPLSEHEQQLLEQMEQALYAEDPKFASQMQGAGARAAARRRMIIGGVGVLAGLALVLVGVSTTMWVGAAGFAVMVLAVVFALTPPRRAKMALGAVQPDGSVRRAEGRAKGKGGSMRAVRGPRSSSQGGRGSRGHESFMQRLEHRWDRRRGDRY
jgi:hypothetical protein